MMATTEICGEENFQSSLPVYSQPEEGCAAVGDWLASLPLAALHCWHAWSPCAWKPPTASCLLWMWDDVMKLRGGDEGKQKCNKIQKTMTDSEQKWPWPTANQSERIGQMENFNKKERIHDGKDVRKRAAGWDVKNYKNSSKKISIIFHKFQLKI